MRGEGSTPSTPNETPLETIGRKNLNRFFLHENNGIQKTKIYPKLVLYYIRQISNGVKPKLILFDLFGTLIQPATKLKPEDFFAFYQKIGIQLKTEEDIKLFTSLFTQLMEKSTNWQDLSQKLLEKTIQKTDNNMVNKLADFYRENFIYQLYDDVKEVINLPYQKAILTGSAPFLFSHFDLEKNFKVFTPRETKFKKPDPQAFLYPLDKLRVKPREVMMVGDEIERDLIPAKNLGMEAILIDRENKIQTSLVKKINSLTKLKKYLNL